MKKQTLIIVVGVALAILGIGILAVVAVFPFSPNTPGAPTNPSDPFQFLGGSGDTTPMKTIQITNKNGEAVVIPDVLTAHEPIDMPSGRFYTLYGPEYSTEGFTFSVQYSVTDSLFLVNLIKEPIGAARHDGENYLRNLLGLTNDELCNLNVEVSVTPDVSEVYSQYQNLGLSFCVDAVPLP